MKTSYESLQKLAKPAQRALTSVGIGSQQELAKYSENQIALLHGIGPNALRQIKQALAKNGLSFSKK